MVTCRATPPIAGTTQMSPRYLKATSWPWGERSGVRAKRIGSWASPEPAADTKITSEAIHPSGKRIMGQILEANDEQWLGESMASAGTSLKNIRRGGKLQMVDVA